MEALPSFILGYHGCDEELAREVIAGNTPLSPSRNDYDWLGDGTYFWEHNAQRAFDFALEISAEPHPSQQRIRTPAVVGAVIDLGYCLNLLDARYIRLVAQAYRDLAAAAATQERSLPTNAGGPDRVSRKLDCAVIRMLHGQREVTDQPPFQSVRAAFFEGKPLYDGAGFAAGNHIQVAIRDQRCIKGYFRPLDERGKPMRFRQS